MILADIRDSRPLRHDIELGGANGFGHVADVEGTGRGRFAVLDRMEKRILVYDSTGRLIRHFGRPGAGPGELSDPIALEWTGTHWVVWDHDPTRTFTIYKDDGNVAGTIPRPVDGDWRSNIYRAGPALREHPYQTPAEDLTRRLQTAGSSHFVHVIQGNEQRLLTSGDTLAALRPNAFAIRYSVSGELVDTISVLAGTPNYLTGAADFHGPLMEQPLFAARPRWAGTHDWYAVGHGDSAYVSVYNWGDPSPRLMIQIATERRIISKADKRAWADWAYRYALSESDDTTWIVDQGRSEYARRTLAVYNFAELAPAVHNLFATGSCLWIGGFDPMAEVDGGALIYVVVSATNGGRVDSIRIDAAGHRVHSIDEYAVLTSSRDETGAFVVTRWPHDVDSCSN